MYNDHAFEIVEGAGCDHLAEKVKAKISEGWECWGGIIGAASDLYMSEMRLVQLMHRRKTYAESQGFVDADDMIASITNKVEVG